MENHKVSQLNHKSSIAGPLVSLQHILKDKPL